MTDENTPTEQGTGHDLRTITPRLADLQRKCRSVGSRNDEAIEMEERIESVLKRLESSEKDEAEPIAFRALARDLYSVERFFESNGFISIAKEVAHVERALESLALSDEPETPETPTVEQTTEEGIVQDTTVEGNEIEIPESPGRWAVPKPLAAVLLFFVVAIAICIVIIVQHETSPSDTTETALRQPAVGPTVPPRRPTALPTPDQSLAAPAPGAVLAEAVGKARLALADGDIEGAIDHLSQAALVDSDHPTVLSTANQLVELLLERADTAVDRGLWEVADLTLSRADRIATRFGLDHHAIEQAARQYEKLDRFIFIRPEKIEAIRAEVGKRTTVYLKDGSKRESVIKGVQNGQLLLNEDTTVRGGTMYYTEKVPLDAIDFLKVWEK